MRCVPLNKPTLASLNLLTSYYLHASLPWYFSHNCRTFQNIFLKSINPCQTM